MLQVAEKKKKIYKRNYTYVKKKKKNRRVNLFLMSWK